MMARMTSCPVASPRAWTIRRWLCPPSRVRASSPPSRSNLTPKRIRSLICCGASRTTISTTAGSHSPAPAIERVLDVVLERVLRGQDAGDAALGVGAVALVEPVLVEDEHVQVGRDFEGGPDAGDAGPDDQDVGELVVGRAGRRTRRDSG